MNKFEWNLIDWDGNRSLGYKCYRKYFTNKGHVSVGVGSFKTIVYSYGANSQRSLSSTRWRPDGNHISEQEAMDEVDKNKGHYRYKNGKL